MEFQRRFPHLVESQQQQHQSASATSSCSALSLPSPSVTGGGLSPDIESHPTTQILPHLYLGNGRDALDVTTLSRLGISRILNVTADLPCPPASSSTLPFDRRIVYKQLPAADSGQQNLRQYFDDAYHFIGKDHYVITPPLFVLSSTARLFINCNENNFSLFTWPVLKRFRGSVCLSMKHVATMIV